MDAVPSSTSPPVAAGASTSAAPSRGAHRGGRRGGRGEGRGRGGGGDRGRGGGRGDGRGRGRGRGDHRGGGRGAGRGYVPKATMRHRSLSGKHGTHDSRDGEPAAKRERKDQKPNSNFALLHSLLGDAALIAEYVRKYHASEKFRDAKSINAFLQAISQRPEPVYEELMARHKDEVFTTLERLFAVYALGKQTMNPPAHEFLIRCEQAGVRNAVWGEGVKTLPEKAPETDEDQNAEGNAGNKEAASSVAPPAPRMMAPTLPTGEASLLSPRELLKKLAALDPVGRLQRLIELSRTVGEMQVCAKKLTALMSESEGTSSGNSVNPHMEGKFDFAAKCQLISKLLSKARRVVEPTFASPPKAAAEAKEGEGNAKAESANEEAEVHENEESELQGEKNVSLSIVDPLAASDADTSTAAPPPVRRRRDSLTDDEVHTFQSTISAALHTLEGVLKSRPPNDTPQPLSKFCKLLEWCKAHGLLASEDERFIALLEQEVESDIAAQATQLETVINLKSLVAGDTAALAQVVDRLWAAGGEKCFVPSSVDVLSAMAVAASADGVAADVKRLVADRLAQTQCHLAGTVVLPRRALRFVNEERNKVKQATIAKQLEETAANYKTEGAAERVEEEGEEEDMELEEA
ncbi:hypothetical protein ABB37_03922 [Leptomonas pyrrhocoris]|uniref:Uncharacterized protein n=1 Tax=Leptomonas pyrrhocoris TaxID=157538 RepID=A0A0M9G3V5_LEPPY|nr:hypothetical protein ABB37_03922 [Leptomonas pyrrhocoris]KPA81586.1 hypothetical protein ABB37_03922 [Leptomonas pyrrhocoris]|eukprot:XP_015660025.1 hypothetical protein ABB37_03922 [Leptomonas pyrrhocoris]